MSETEDIYRQISQQSAQRTVGHDPSKLDNWRASFRSQGSLVE